MPSKRSFQLLRTNPALTSNIKVVVDDNYKLYLESFNTNKELNNSKYKKYPISEDQYYDTAVANFWNKLDSSIVFDVKESSKQDTMYSEYNTNVQQFDPIYYAGASQIEDQKHKNEYEYLAPLYVKPKNLPEGFIILRVDGPAIFNPRENYKLDSLTNNNFREQIIDKWKAVSIFDMTENTRFGEWVNKNFVDYNLYPYKAFEFDTRENSNPTWHGLNYLSGVWSKSTSSFKDILKYSHPHFKFEEKITRGFKENNLIYPHIINFKFLFDDNPGDPFRYNKYSINRYYGFYIDKLDWVTNLTSYDPPKLKSGIKIVNNIFTDEDDFKQTVYPFKDENFDPNKKYYIYAKGGLHEVKRNLEEGEYVYKIISDKEIKIEDVNTKGIVDINYESSERKYYESTIVGRYDNLELDPYIDRNDNKKGLYGDLYVIKIDNKYHVLKHRESEEFIEQSSGSTLLDYTGQTNDIVGDEEWIYAATENEGIKVFDWDGNLTWEIKENENTDIPSNKVNTLYIKNKILYAGTPNGIWIKDFNDFSKTGNIVLNTDNTNMPCNNIHEIYFDTYLVISCSSASSYIWWTDYSDNGVIDNDNGKMSQWKDVPINGFSIDETNNLYVAEGKVIRKYYEFDKDSFLEFNSTIYQMPDATINDIYVEDDGIYAGTEKGFWIKKGPFEKLYNSDRYENLDNDYISSIQVDTDNGIAYLATDSGSTKDGFYILNYFDNVVEKYTQEEYSSINQSINSIVAHVDRNKIAYGTENGTQIFRLPLTSSTSFKRFEYYLNTDYAILSNKNVIEYWRGNEEENNEYVLKTIGEDEEILEFPVYRIKFSDIKDFDFDRVDTNYANFDYLQNDKYTDTEEPKLHATNYMDEFIPRDYRRYQGGKNDGRIINVSSEYVSDDELWEIKKPSNLSKLWTKNQYVCKWGASDSISHSDYPYKLNNYTTRNNKLSKFNRTTNVNLEIIDIREKNLDYMYRIGNFIENSGGTEKHYFNQSTNVETDIMNEDSRRFNIDKYVQSEFDYFHYFFDNFMKQRVDNSDESRISTKKFSLFGQGSEYESSNTVFGGVFYKIHNINDIVYTLNDNNQYDVKKIKKKQGLENQFNNYKFSVIFNPAYDYQVDCNIEEINTGKIDNRLIKPLIWYNPIYLKGYDFYNNPMDPIIRGFDSGSTNNVQLKDNNFTDLTYIEGETKRVSPIFKSYVKEDELLYMKSQGYLYLKVNYNLSSHTIGFQNFSDIDIKGEFVQFSGETFYNSEGVPEETTEEISNFYKLDDSSSQVGERFISLTKWDIEDFKDNYDDWVSQRRLYRIDNKLRNEGVIDTNDLIENEEKGIHVFLNDIYKNCLVVVNSPILMKEDYVSLNNIEKFFEKYGFYYGVTINNEFPYNTGQTYSTVINSGKTIVGDQCPEILNDGELVYSRNEMITTTPEGLWVYNFDYKQGKMINSVEENEDIDNLDGLVNIEKLNDNEFYLLNISGQSFLYNIDDGGVTNYNEEIILNYYDSKNENIYLQKSGGTVILNNEKLSGASNGEDLPDGQIRGFKVDEELNDVYLYGDFGFWKYDIDEDSGITFQSGTTSGDMPSNDVKSLVVNNGIIGVSFNGSSDNDKIWIYKNNEGTNYKISFYKDFILYYIDERYLIKTNEFLNILLKFDYINENINEEEYDILVSSFKFNDDKIYLYDINNLYIYEYPSFEKIYDWGYSGEKECIDNEAIIDRSFYNTISNDYILSLTGESDLSDYQDDVENAFDNDLSTSWKNDDLEDRSFKISELNRYINFIEIVAEDNSDSFGTLEMYLNGQTGSTPYESFSSFSGSVFIKINQYINQFDFQFTNYGSIGKEWQIKEIKIYKYPKPNQFIIEDSNLYLFGHGLQKIRFNYGSENIYSSSSLVAKKYIDALNSVNKSISFDRPVTYHHIDESGHYNKYKMEGNQIPPYLLQVYRPQSLKVNRNSYTIQPIDGPNTNIKNFQRPGQNPQPDDVIKRPLARIININRSIRNDLKNTIYRYNANYEPVFKNIEVFNKLDYDIADAMKVYPENYRFFEDYSKFGKVDEIMYTKVNENGSILKLKNSNKDSSIYPMVDEFGYGFTDRFIFKSNWDSEFYIRTIKKLKD